MIFVKISEYPDCKAIKLAFPQIKDAFRDHERNLWVLFENGAETQTFINSEKLGAI